jgi:PhzF family phenazine biosynthesis protein
MELRLYQVDAFTDRVFGGNPAGVCPLEEWLPEDTMQRIANENNLAETAFFVGDDGGYHIRWFTPECEVDLCGHATLASGHVVFTHLGHDGDSIRFDSASGPLGVRRDGAWFVLDFPTRDPRPCEPPAQIAGGLGREPLEVLSGANYMAVFDAEEDVAALKPDFRILGGLGDRGLIVTAPGRDVDFVSRYFAPAWGIDEDHATGSSHCELAPYWAARLGKNRLEARQLSRRGGRLRCSLLGERVEIAGQAVTYLEGTIRIP